MTTKQPKYPNICPSCREIISGCRCGTQNVEEQAEAVAEIDVLQTINDASSGHDLAAELAASRVVIEAIGDQLPHGTKCWHKWRVQEKGKEIILAIYNCRCGAVTRFTTTNNPTKIDLALRSGPNLCRDWNSAIPVERWMLSLYPEKYIIELADNTYMRNVATLPEELDEFSCEDIAQIFHVRQPWHIIFAAAEVLKKEMTE